MPLAGSNYLYIDMSADNATGRIFSRNSFLSLTVIMLNYCYVSVFAVNVMLRLFV